MGKGRVPVHLELAISRFEDAVRALAFKGAQHPEDHAAIEARYQGARASLRGCIARAIEKANTKGVSPK